MTIGADGKYSADYIVIGTPAFLLKSLAGGDYHSVRRRSHFLEYFSRTIAAIITAGDRGKRGPEQNVKISWEY